MAALQPSMAATQAARSAGRSRAVVAEAGALLLLLLSVRRRGSRAGSAEESRPS